MMVPLLPLAMSSAATLTATLTATSLINILQTFQLKKVMQIGSLQEPKSPNNNLDVLREESSLLSTYLTPLQAKTSNGDDDGYISNTVTMAVSIPTTKTTREILQDLQSMNRKEIMTLFMHCSVPDDGEDNLKDMLEGDWDGCLLDNNNWIMTGVSNFITHKLFGSGNTWKGKRFYKPNQSTSHNVMLGVNLFEPKSNGANDIVKERNKNESVMTKHDVDCMLLQSSSLISNFFGGNGIRLKYNNYQPLLSPWRTMEDELRVLKLPQLSSSSNDGDDGRILIGMGSMAWSGGFWNSSPFCLVQGSKQQ